MPRAGTLFAEGSDSESEIKTENEYAKNYDNWRKKEELNRLKTKYGETVLESNESSSSSDDDEDASELTEEIEKNFFKTLSFLKKKDPKIYDNNISFFKDKIETVKKKKKTKEQPLYLKDYERKLLLKTGGVLSEDEDGPKSKPKTYVKEQEELKRELIELGSKIDEDEEEDEMGGLLQLRNKTNEEESKNETEYLKWLAGQKDEIADGEIQSELKPLKEYWNDPKLDKGEKFLRDYILSKRYLDKDDDSYVPTYDEIIHDSDNSLSGDESEIEKQEEFEHKYNFRFEEPDQEFIKRYPRTVEHSLRKTDDKRKIKRAETKDRKKKEKEEKMADIKHMQQLKRKEIEEKIEKLKEVTGATDVAFAEDDIDGDFDPEAHDKRMQALFNDEFYEGPENDQKPNFPDLDEELEIENWDRWDGAEDVSGNDPHCEDESFNMDADYDPSTSLKSELIENSKGRKKRRRRSKVAEALSKPKPKYDLNDKNYEKYFDEYYKLDCEDIIGDIPCRFKYREVLPNDFGLSVEEILMAKDKELNRWCSLKKAVQRRPEHVEKYEQIAYAKKANNIDLKKRLLPSLFSEEPDQEQKVETASKTGETFMEGDSSVSINKSTHDNDQLQKNEDHPVIVKKSNKKIIKTKVHAQNVERPLKATETIVENNCSAILNISENQPQQNEVKLAIAKEEKKERKKKKPKKKVDKNSLPNAQAVEINNESTKELKPAASNNDNNKKISQQSDKKRGKKRKHVDSEVAKRQSKKIKKEVNVGMSDARLSAFGLNPKKFKNKLKYGNKTKKQKT